MKLKFFDAQTKTEKIGEVGVISKELESIFPTSEYIKLKVVESFWLGGKQQHNLYVEKKNIIAGVN